jgi:hypothetical protein
MLQIAASSGNSILDSRVEKSGATTDEAEKIDMAIDDMMKEIVDEQLGAAAYADDADRAVAYNLGHFRVQTDAALGAVETKYLSFRNILSVLKGLHQTSQTNGPLIFFDVVAVSPSVYEFRTYANQRGADKRFSAAKSTLVFSLENGNLRKPQLTEDNHEEKNVVYVAGDGTGTDREIVEREDTSLSTQSIWARREIFRDARKETTTAGLESLGDEVLGEKRPTKRFVADMLSIPGSEYSVDWDYGDRATAYYNKRVIDIQILIVYVTVTDDGKEEVYARNEFGDFNA